MQREMNSAHFLAAVCGSRDSAFPRGDLCNDQSPAQYLRHEASSLSVTSSIPLSTSTSPYRATAISRSTSLPCSVAFPKKTLLMPGDSADSLNYLEQEILAYIDCSCQRPLPAKSKKIRLAPPSETQEEYQPPGQVVPRPALLL